MPDRFVAADTTDRSNFLNELFFSGVITQTAFDLADSQRERLNAYGSAEKFMKDYQVSSADLGKLLDLRGQPDEKQRIWPIVQLADWGEKVAVDQIPTVLDCGTRRPATGTMVFHWSGISREGDKLAALGTAFRAMHG